MKQSLSRKLTSVILLTVLIAVGLVSFSSSYFIHDQFKDYIIEKQTQTINQIVILNLTCNKYLTILIGI